MKKVYESPKFSVVEFETEDIVRTSSFVETQKFNNLSINDLLSMEENS